MEDILTMRLPCDMCDGGEDYGDERDDEICAQCNGEGTVIVPDVGLMRLRDQIIEQTKENR